MGLKLLHIFATSANSIIMKTLLALVTFAIVLDISSQGTIRKKSTEWDEVCGASRYEDAGSDQNLFQIVNGWEARIHEFPWQAGLRFQGSHSCGAVVINSRWVITAAHCVDGRSASDITIRVGDHDFENPTEALIEFDVELIVIHENYDETDSLENDIAVIKVSDEIPGGEIPNYENVTAACKPDRDFGDAYGSASGWGRLEDGGELPTVLNYVNNPVLTQQECFDCLPDYILPGMLCWGYCGSNNRSTCNGDSGGPLSIKGDDGIFQVIGLTSFNVGGCVSENPKIFTNVTYFVPWIEDKIAEF